MQDIDPLGAVAAANLELAKRYRRLETFAGDLAAMLEAKASEAGASDESTPDLLERPDAPEPGRPQVARIETPSADLPSLLNFQEQLAELQGVTKVTITGSGSRGTVFLVELDDGAHSQNRVVCSQCGKTLNDGPEPVSHGLCEDCRALFGTAR